MLERIRGRLTYANVMSTIAVFGALATGGAFAASQIGTNAIKDGAVTAKKLHKNAVTRDKINDGAVTGAKVARHSLTGANIRASSLGEVSAANHATSADHAASADSATNAGHSTNSDRLGGVAAASYETPSSVLQSGQTEHGVFAGGGGTGDNIVIQVQFVPRLPSALDSSHVIFVNGTSATHCPGHGRADRGYLCWYEVTAGSFTFGSFGDPTTDSAGASSEGVDAQYSSSGNVRISGEWAVTAP